MASTPFQKDAHNESEDRENLSALFDGELDGDAARFTHKRLGHDAQWRETCGRWQLCGDVLRGQARGTAAPGFAGSGFADRVAAAIAADAALQASRDTVSNDAAVGLKPRRAAGSRRGWIGGAALAASVAVAALFVARPFADDSATGVVDPAQVATQSTAAPAQPSQPAPIPVPAPAPAEQALAAVPVDADPSLTSADASGIAAAAVAVAELPRRLNERRSRGQSQRAAVRASERQSIETPLQLAAVGGTSAVAVSETHPNPFRPQQSDVPAARPWPRAALPNYQSAGSGYVASYGSSGLSSPSFYPFEPATQAEEARAAQARAEQGRQQSQERPQP